MSIIKNMKNLVSEIAQLKQEVDTARNLASLSCDLIEDWKRKYAELEAKFWTIRSKWICADCGIACSPENENQKCDRESYSHDWQRPRTFEEISECCQHLNMIKERDLEIERLRNPKSPKTWQPILEALQKAIPGFRQRDKIIADFFREIRNS